MILIDFYVEQKTAYELRISDWSSDVCSSDLGAKSGLPRQSLDFGRFSAFCRAKRMCRSPKFLHFLPRPAHCSYGRVWIRPFARTPHGTGLLSDSAFSQIGTRQRLLRRHAFTHQFDGPTGPVLKSPED